MIPILAANLLRGGGAAPVGVALADARLIANWNNVSELDDQSILDATYTESGSPTYGDGFVVLDGASYWESDQSFKEYHFPNAGESFTVEFFAVRPDADNAVVASTSADHTSTTTGWIVRADTDGTVKFHNFRNATPMVGSFFASDVLPAGPGPYGGRHHVVVEGYHLSREAKGVAVIRVGVNGQRNPYAVERKHFTNTGFMSHDGPVDHTLRVGFGTTQYFDGTLGRVRVSRGLVYDLWANSTYTVPSGDFVTTESVGFKAFSARPSVKYRPDVAATYRAFPSIAPLSTAGEFGMVLYGGAAHEHENGEIYWQKSTDGARGWSDPVAITSTTTSGWHSRDARITRLPSGRQILTWFEHQSSTQKSLAKWKYSDDDGDTWSSVGDLKAAFSATMQSLGSGPRVRGNVIVTPNGPAVVGHVNNGGGAGRLEIIFYDEGSNSWGSPVLISTGAYYDESVLVACDGTGTKLVVVSRIENDSDAWVAHTSPNGGLAWSSAGSADWQRNATHRSPPMVINDGEGNIVTMMLHRTKNGLRHIDYSVTDQDSFFANPLRAWDGTETKTIIHRLNVLVAEAEVGYPSITKVDGGYLVAWYEGIRNSSTETEIMVMGVESFPSTGRNWFNQLLLLSGGETDGTTDFIDESLYGREYTINGSVVTDTAVQIVGKNTLLFGSTGYLRIPFNKALRLRNEDFTIRGWAKVGGSNGTNRFLMAVWNGSGSQRCWHAGLGTANTFNFSWSTTGSGAAGNLESTTAFSVGDVFFYEICRHGTDLRMFINGVMEAKATGVDPNLFASNQDLLIGATNGGSNSYWAGAAAEIMIDTAYASRITDDAYSVPVDPFDRF